MEMFKRLVFSLWCVLFASQVQALDLRAGPSASARNEQRQVDAKVLIHAPQAITPNSRFHLGVLLTHKPGWHTYWINPGDSGLPTTLNWSLPSGMSAQTIQWPLPQKITVAGLTNYGFEGQTLLVVPIQVNSSFRPSGSGDFTVGLEANWLACENACIPESAQIQVRFPLKPQTEHAFDFQTVFDQQPRQVSRPIQARWVGDQLAFSMADLPSGWKGHSVEAYPMLKETLASSMERNGSAKWVDDSWQMNAKVHDMLVAPVSDLPMVLVSRATGSPQAIQVKLQIQGTWPEPPGPSSGPSSGPIASASGGQAGLSPTPIGPVDALQVVWACLGALLGGVLLNLMPCVLPVLSIKALSFSKSNLDPRQRRLQGLSFALGTVGTVALVGLALMAFRATGAQLGWGFQLQSPWMVVFLITLFALMAFNLWGVFEWPSLSWSLPARPSTTEGIGTSFGSGVLTVLVATPCTAPFMGASLGLAVTLPTWAALPVFVSLGLGLALPLTLLSWMPQLNERLPRPGAWMLRFRQASGFPMMATSLWLMWVLNQQTDADVVAWTSLFLLALAALLATPSLSAAWRWTARSFLLAILVFCTAQWFKSFSDLNLPTSNSTSQGIWQAWSPEAVEQAKQSGKAVFVDFTAAWCITCQFNEKAVLARNDVRQAFLDKKVVTFKADWTRQDPRITQALRDLGRSGVPVYALSSPAPGQTTKVFSEILDADELLAALRALP